MKGCREIELTHSVTVGVSDFSNDSFDFSDDNDCEFMDDDIFNCISNASVAGGITDKVSNENLD